MTNRIPPPSGPDGQKIHATDRKDKEHKIQKVGSSGEEDVAQRFKKKMEQDEPEEGKKPSPTTTPGPYQPSFHLSTMRDNDPSHLSLNKTPSPAYSAPPNVKHPAPRSEDPLSASHLPQSDHFLSQMDLGTPPSHFPPQAFAAPTAEGRTVKGEWKSEKPTQPTKEKPMAAAQPQPKREQPQPTTQPTKEKPTVGAQPQPTKEKSTVGAQPQPTKEKSTAHAQSQPIMREQQQSSKPTVGAQPQPTKEKSTAHAQPQPTKREQQQSSKPTAGVQPQPVKEKSTAQAQPQPAKEKPTTGARPKREPPPFEDQTELTAQPEQEEPKIEAQPEPQPRSRKEKSKGRDSQAASDQPEASLQPPGGQPQPKVQSGAEPVHRREDHARIEEPSGLTAGPPAQPTISKHPKARESQPRPFVDSKHPTKATSTRAEGAARRAEATPSAHGRKEDKKEKDAKHKEEKPADIIPPALPLFGAEVAATATHAVSAAAPYLRTTEIVPLFFHMVGTVTSMATKGISSTEVLLNNPAFAGSKFYGSTIEIIRYSTAPDSFNIRLSGSNEAVNAFNRSIPELVASFQNGNFNFRIGRIDAVYSLDKSAFREKREGGDEGGSGGEGGESKERRR